MVSDEKVINYKEPFSYMTLGKKYIFLVWLFFLNLPVWPLETKFLSSMTFRP
jgi:hypothetical protein